MTDRFGSFADWFSGAEGDYLRAREQAMFDAVVSDLFGFNAVQVGLSQADLLCTSRIKHLVHLDSTCPADVRADPLQLPFANQSIDLLLLPHVLEFSDWPHQILREAERVLIPEGNLLLTGFNPWSLYGFWHWYQGMQGESPWRGHFLSLHRLRDWLSLLGCELVSIRMCCYVPPLANKRWVQWFERLEIPGEHWWSLGGSVYFVHAIKRVHGMHLIVPGWNDAAHGLGKILQPTTRAYQQDYKKVS